MADVLPACRNALPTPGRPLQVLQLVKMQVDPHVVYVSSKADAELLDACRRPVDNSEAGAQFDVRLERASLFTYQKASARLRAHIRARTRRIRVVCCRASMRPLCVCTGGG